MNYISHLNGLIKAQVERRENIVLFGQNINAGSCISGFTRGMNVAGSSKIINTPNIENTQVGFGFGLMMGGISSVFFVKQLDFLFLGLDHFVNTFNFVRTREFRASFTIMPVVVDSGWEGMMASCNQLSDFCSMGRTDGYTITNRNDAEAIIKTQLFRPGFRIIAVSSRLFKQEIIGFDGEVHSEQDAKLFRYKKGGGAAIVCFNFSLPQGLSLHNHLLGRGIATSLYSVNSAMPIDWSPVIDDLKNSRRMVVFDDGKSACSPAKDFLYEALRRAGPLRQSYVAREFSSKWFMPSSDEFIPNNDEIMRDVFINE